MQISILEAGVGGSEPEGLHDEGLNARETGVHHFHQAELFETFAVERPFECLRGRSEEVSQQAEGETEVVRGLDGPRGRRRVEERQCQQIEGSQRRQCCSERETWRSCWTTHSWREWRPLHPRRPRSKSPQPRSNRSSSRRRRRRLVRTSCCCWRTRRHSRLIGRSRECSNEQTGTWTCPRRRTCWQCRAASELRGEVDDLLARNGGARARRRCRARGTRTRRQVRYKQGRERGRGTAERSESCWSGSLREQSLQRGSGPAACARSRRGWSEEVSAGVEGRECTYQE